MTQGFFEEKLRYEAVFQLLKKDYPELKDAKVIITDDVDHVYIGVTTRVLVVERFEDGSFKANENQVGEYCKVSKNDPISKFFDSLREMLEVVSKAADEVKKGVKA